MALLLSRITEVIRSLAVSLQFSMLIPAMLLVGGMLWLVSPNVLTTDTATAVIIGAASLIISYVLNAFNMPIIRLFEGYIMGETPLAYALRTFEMATFHRHHKRVREYTDKVNVITRKENTWVYSKVLTPSRQLALNRWKDGWQSRIDHECERLEERFPPFPEYVLPTSLGNAIAAFEHYPRHRYGIDMIRLWPRFVPTLLENKYASFIESEKAILDFLVNLLFCAILIWPVALYEFALTGRDQVGITLLAIPMAAFIVYKGACVAAVNWGYTVKSAFDLYRFDLRRALHLKINQDNTTLSTERAMWQGVSEFLAFGSQDNFEGFDYKTALVTQDARNR